MEVDARTEHSNLPKVRDEVVCQLFLYIFPGKGNYD